jgi:hypothetical protein
MRPKHHPQFEHWHPCVVSTTDERTWLTVPDLAERLDLTPSRVRRLIEDRQLLAVRRDGVLSVPEVFLDDEGPLPELRGTAILLADSGYTNDEAMNWLLEEDDSLGVAPIDALRAGRKAEVRRVAQALAF